MDDVNEIIRKNPSAAQLKKQFITYTDMIYHLIRHGFNGHQNCVQYGHYAGSVLHEIESLEEEEMLSQLQPYRT